jgi:hypothetical protein
MILLISIAGYRIAQIPVGKKYHGNFSPVNIYKFGGQVLARLWRYPLARAGLVRPALYRRNQWPSLSQLSVPEPVPFVAPHEMGRAAAI